MDVSNTEIIILVSIGTLFIGFVIAQIVTTISKKNNPENETSIHIPKSSDRFISSEKSENSLNEQQLAAELQKIQSKHKKKKTKPRPVDSPPKDSRTSQFFNNNTTQVFENEQAPQKAPKTIHDFVPLEDSQVRNPAEQVEIPDHIFRQNTVPKKGVLAIPYKIIQIDGVQGCLLFDRAGLVISASSNTRNFDKNRLAAYSLETLRTLGKMGVQKNTVTWFSAWIGNQAVIVIEKEEIGCTLTLARKVDIVQIANLAMSLISQLTSHLPKEYK